MTALHIAAGSEHIGTARTLINENAYLESEDRRCWTPLHVAAARGNNEMVKLLVESGADCSALDNMGFTPLKVANHQSTPGACRATQLVLKRAVREREASLAFNERLHWDIAVLTSVVVSSSVVIAYDYLRSGVSNPEAFNSNFP